MVRALALLGRVCGRPWPAFLVASSALVALESAARAGDPQTSTLLTSDGIQCDGDVVTLDTIYGPTESANVGLLETLDQNYASLSEAAVTCEQWPYLPGCDAVHEWSSLSDSERTRVTKNEHELVPAALLAQVRRVAAHATCQYVTKRTGNDATCATLVEKEAEAGHFGQERTLDVQAGVKAILGVPQRDLDTKQLPDMRALFDNVLTADEKKPPAAGDEATRDKAATAITNAMQDANDKCLKASDCKPPLKTKMTASEVAASVGKLTWFYDGLRASKFPTLSRSVTPALVAAIDALKLAKPQARWPPREAPANSFDAIFAHRQNVLRDQSHDCPFARYYVAPSGALVFQRLQPNNDICIDTTGFRVDQPFEVNLTEYPFPTPTVSGVVLPVPASRSYVLTAYAGERVRLPAFTHSTVRITVRGYPSGPSLRSLVISGTAHEDLSFESVRLLLLQQQEEEQTKDATSYTTTTRAVQSALGTALGKDETVGSKTKALTTALDVAQRSIATKEEFAKAVVSATTALDDLWAAMEAVATKLPQTGAVNPLAVLTTQAGDNKPKPPEKGKDNDQDKYVTARTKGDALIALPLDLQKAGADATPKPATAKTKSLSEVIGRICRLSKELIPVVDEDVLLDDEEALESGIYVLDYDFDSGFERTTPRPLTEKDSVFVRVRHVRPGYAVSVSFDDKGVVQHAVSLIGMPSSSTATGASTESASSASAPDTGDADPDNPLVEARSTQIMSLGRLGGRRRYDITLCVQEGAPSANCSAGGSAPPPNPTVEALTNVTNTLAATVTKLAATNPAAAGASDSKKPAAPAGSRVIARNTLVVHQKGYLGVRLGVGADVAFGAVRELDTLPGSGNQIFVRSTDLTGDFALPLLVTYYVGGRDLIDGPPGRLTHGPSLGLDLLKIGADPRLYLGYTLDVAGFGVTFGGSLSRIQSVDAPPGTYVGSNATGTLLDQMHGGVFAAATTDLDIFEAVYRSYFAQAQFPTIGTGTP